VIELLDMIQVRHCLCKQAPQNLHGVSLSAWDAYQEANKDRDDLLKIIDELNIEYGH
jgi:cation transport regulator ChaB